MVAWRGHRLKAAADVAQTRLCRLPDSRRTLQSEPEGTGSSVPAKRADEHRGGWGVAFPPNIRSRL